MPANIEIKARLRDRAGFIDKARALATEPPEILSQEDVFFTARHGRLKLRIFGLDRGELIFYQRPDTAGPRQSDYVISKTRDVTSLRAALTGALDVVGVVHKRREVYLVGQTRIHVDQVEGLGDFMEFEVVLQPGQTGQDGERIAEDLMAEFELRPDDLIEGAYIDLLLAREPER